MSYRVMLRDFGAVKPVFMGEYALKEDAVRHAGDLRSMTPESVWLEDEHGNRIPECECPK